MLCLQILRKSQLVFSAQCVFLFLLRPAGVLKENAVSAASSFETVPAGMSDPQAWAAKAKGVDSQAAGIPTGVPVLGIPVAQASAELAGSSRAVPGGAAR